jgi:hypothetical protein
MEPDCGQCVIVVGLCLRFNQGDDVIKSQVFEQIVAFAGRDGQVHQAVTEAEYDQWKRDYVWLALHGQRYGQSFCNTFGITDNHLYYAPGGVDWCDQYIRKHYIDRS